MLYRIKDFFNKGNKRSTRAKKNIAVMFLLRGISVVCSLIIVPLTISYVSDYEYGIWLTISSLVAWLSFFDLGIGNGLRNKFIEAITKKKYILAKIYVSTAYAIISIVVSIVWLIAIMLTFLIDWCSLLNVTITLSNDLVWTLVIVITNFSVIFILGLNKTLLNAIQEPAIASSFDTITQFFLCVVLFILVKFTRGSLIHLALAMGGTSVLVLTLSNLWTFKTILKQYKPSLKKVRFRLAKGILSLGLTFFFLQIIAIAFYQTNNLIISHFSGPNEVTVYNIAYKYMQILTMIFSILISPFWSAYSEANLNGDFTWMKNTTKRLVQMVVLIAILGILMIIISPFFYKIWLNDSIRIPILITVLVYAFQMANIWSTLWTQLLCAFGKIKLQLICSSICVFIYLPMGIYGCKYYGVTGLLIAGLLSCILCTSWFGIIQVKKIINKSATGLWDK